MQTTAPEAIPRFDRRRRLGAGGFGEVFEAWDRDRDSLVALKRLKRLGPESVRRFKHEFRSLAHLSHPNLAQLYELVSDGEHWWFTMELVNGLDFVSAMREGVRDSDVGALPLETEAAADAAGPSEPAAPRYDEERLRGALRQLVRGVRALHVAGKLHRDIKPHNVLVTPTGRVVILDFGMVRELRGANQGDPSNFVGTPHYMAPEQAQHVELTPASDWYSVGVILFEVLTGNYPVQGRTVMQLLLRKQVAEPPADEDFPAGTSPALREMCQRLLALSPDDRPAADEILTFLGDDRGDAPKVIVRDADLDTPLIGRSEESTLLRARARAARADGAPRLTALVGASGIGKSALAWDFAAERRDAGELVLISRCWENESVPYKAMDGIVDELVGHLSSLSDAEVELMLSGDVGALARVFGAFGHLPMIRDFAAARPSSSDVPSTRRAAFRALGALLREVAVDRPVSLVIDDAQWGDRDSADALVEVLSGPSPPPVFLLLTYRDGEADRSPFLERLSELDASMQVIELNRLGAADASELARAWGAAGPRADEIARAAGGDPYLVQALVDLSDTDVATVEEAVLSRIGSLEPDDRSFVEVLSIASQPLDASIVRDAAGAGTDLPQLLARLRNLRLLRLRADRDGSAVEPYHDRIRQALNPQIPDPLRTRHNLRLAQVLERRGVDDPELLAHHFRQGGEPTRSSRYARRAADSAMDKLAYDRAATGYSAALRDGDWSDEDTLELQTRLGTALSYLGRGKEAAEALVRGAVHGTKIESIALRRRAAEQLLRGGQFVRGFELLDAVLGELGIETPRSDAKLNLALLTESVRAWWRGNEFVELEEPLEPLQAEKLDTLWAAANMMATLDVRRGVYFTLLNARASLDCGEPERVSRTLALQSVHAASRSKTRPKSDQLIETAAELVELSPDPIASGALVDFCRAMRGYMVGDVRTAHACFGDTERKLQRGNDRFVWERKLTQMYDLFNQYHLGQLTSFVENIEEGARDAAARDDMLQWSAILLWGHIAHLIADEPDTAHAELERASAAWNLPDVFLLHDFWRLQGELRTSLYAGEPERGLLALERAWPGLRRGLFLTLDLTRAIIFDLRGRCHLASAAGATDAAAKSRSLRLARRDARKLGAVGLAWSDAAAKLLQAQVELAQGDHAAAHVTFARVESELSALGYETWVAAVRVRLGELLDDEQEGGLRERALNWFETRGVQDPRRFVSMLVPIGVDS